MPTYTILNKNTGDVYSEYFTSYSELEEFLSENSSLTLGAPDSVNIVSGSGDAFRKTDSSFKDLLKSIKKGSGGTFEV